MGGGDHPDPLMKKLVGELPGSPCGKTMRKTKKVNENYAHMLIVVAFLVVNFFVFLVITRNHTMRFGPKLEEIFL